MTTITNAVNIQNEILSIKNRIHLLTMRDPVSNENIIRKQRRRLRKLEASISNI